MTEVDIATSNPDQFTVFARFLMQNNIRAFQLEIPPLGASGDIKELAKTEIMLAQQADQDDQSNRRNILVGKDDDHMYVIGAANETGIRFFESDSKFRYDHPLSSYILGFHSFPLNQLTCRPNYHNLAQFIENGNVSFSTTPDTWIMGNALFQHLDHPLYRRLTAFNLNERGMFLKVWSLESQKNYWNSSLNGGLPITRKRDEVHEGTFMLHDMFHFVFRDPIVTGHETPEEQKSFIAYRMMSEAWTLILADMLSIDISGLDGTGYNTSARKAYPLLKSMNLNPRNLDDLKALLYANSVYCLLGDDSEFRTLGAAGEELEEYKSKYGIFFSVDSQWNKRNIENIIRIAQQNPKLQEYSNALPEELRKLDTKALHSKIVMQDGRLSIDRLFDVFWDQFIEMTQYEKPVSHIEYAKRGIRKYLSGQINVAFQFPDSNFQDLISEFQESARLVKDSSDLQEVLEIYRNCIGSINSFIDSLIDNQALLPHQGVVYKLGVPRFPPIFLSYDKPQTAYLPLDEASAQIFAGSLIREDFGISKKPISDRVKINFLWLTSSR